MSDEMGKGYSRAWVSPKPSSPLRFWPHDHGIPFISLTKETVWPKETSSTCVEIVITFSGTMKQSIPVLPQMYNSPSWVMAADVTQQATFFICLPRRPGTTCGVFVYSNSLPKPNWNIPLEPAAKTCPSSGCLVWDKKSECWCPAATEVIWQPSSPATLNG